MMTHVLEPLHLSLEAEAKSLAPLRRAVQTWLTDAGAHDVHAVVLAVDEAVANAVEHAGLSSAALITVGVEVVDEMLRVQISDHGAWKEQAVDETRGRGLFIMNAVMDSVSIEHRDGETRLVMFRHLRNGQVGA